MRIEANLTYEEVQKRHPAELNRLIDRLRNSTSKQKNEDPKKLRFEYHYGMSGTSMSGTEFMEMVAGKRPAPPPPPETEDDIFNDWMARSTGVTLQAKLGRWWGSERVPNPPELAIQHRKHAKEQAARIARLKGRTPAEKEADTKALLGELAGMGGFFGVVRR